MIGRRSKVLPRWVTAWLLGALLLAAQQFALLHPLSHLHDEAPASAATEVACSLCLGCAAAGPLATTAAATALAVPRGAPAVGCVAPSRLVVWAPSTGHNRGPPGTV